MEGYSVARRDLGMLGFVYTIYREDKEVARIRPLLSGKLAFTWHDKFMWSFSANDFVICASVNQAQQ